MNETEAVAVLLKDAMRELAARDARIAELANNLIDVTRTIARQAQSIENLERRLAQLQEDFAASIEARTN